MPSSGNVAYAVADATTAPTPPPPPPQQQELALPSPGPTCPSEDVFPLPVSPPDGSPARARRSKRARAAPAEEGAGTAVTPRRKRRGTTELRAAVAAASPRKNVGRPRRRLEREEAGKEVVEVEAAGRTRRRKTAARAQGAKGLVAAVEEEKGSSLALVSYRPSNLTYGTNNDRQNHWECLWEMVVDLVMWKNVDKSAFWFGSGSMLFVSSSFSRDINFSPISVCCHFGVVILGLAFFKDSFLPRQQGELVRRFQLTEEDVLRAAQAVLPVANTIISMAQWVFSGDPSMTLKVLPILLFGAKFGHLLTLRSILATGFFSCFTLPKLYRCYSSQVHKKATDLKDQILNAWKSCPRKKLVVAAAVTTFWNLISVKTRIMAAFFCAVTLRCYYQHRRTNCSSHGEMHKRHGEEQTMVKED
uniref:Reticulon-like protein n=1 Tax=Arundo donax TaxID=35708 RepID=A0A0A9CTA4_ARUDO